MLVRNGGEKKEGTSRLREETGKREKKEKMEGKKGGCLSVGG